MLGFVDHASAIYGPGSGFGPSAPPVPMALHQQSFSTFKDHDQGSDISQLKDEIADLKKDREIRAGEYSGFEPSAPPVPMAPPHQQSFLTFKDRDQGSDIS